jgi:hypothetical protein
MKGLIKRSQLKKRYFIFNAIRNKILLKSLMILSVAPFNLLRPKNKSIKVQPLFIKFKKSYPPPSKIINCTTTVVL